MELATKLHTFTGHAAAIYTLCEGTDNDHFFSAAGDRIVAEWNLVTGQQQGFTAQLPSPVFSILYLKQFNQLWAGTFSGQVHILDLSTKKEVYVFQYHTAQVFDLQFNRATGQVVSSGGDGNIVCYDPEKLQVIHHKNFSEKKIRSVLPLENKLILSEATGLTIILDEKLEITHSFQSHNKGTNCALMDGDILFTAGRDAHINLWDTKTNYSLIKSIPAHNYAIYRLLDLPNGLMASCGMDKTIKLWDKNASKVIQRIDREKNGGHAFSVNALIWNKTHQLLISAGDDRQIMSWRIEWNNI